MGYHDACDNGMEKKHSMCGGLEQNPVDVSTIGRGGGSRLAVIGS